MLTSSKKIIIRQIEAKDNAAIAGIIRSTLMEFGAAKQGTVYYDPTTDYLFELFSTTPQSIYYIAEADKEILGGGGIFPTDGLPPGICELVKMYLLPQARGLGLGKSIMAHCLQFAKKHGYNAVYLETMPELKQALKAYEKLGFEYLKGPMGNSGHHGCELWMMKELTH